MPSLQCLRHARRAGITCSRSSWTSTLSVAWSTRSYPTDTQVSSYATPSCLTKGETLLYEHLKRYRRHDEEDLQLEQEHIPIADAEAVIASSAGRSPCGGLRWLARWGIAEAELLRIGVAARRNVVTSTAALRTPRRFPIPRVHLLTPRTSRRPRRTREVSGPHAGKDRLRKGAFTAGLHRLPAVRPRSPFDMARPRGGGMCCVVDRRAQPSENNGTLLGVGPSASPARAKRSVHDSGRAQVHAARTGDRRHALRCC